MLLLSPQQQGEGKPCFHHPTWLGKGCWSWVPCEAAGENLARDIQAWEKPVFLSDLETIQACFCYQFKNILLPRSIILNPLHGPCCSQGAGRSRSHAAVSAQGNGERQAPAPLWGCYYVGSTCGDGNAAILLSAVFSTNILTPDTPLPPGG